MRRKWQSRGFTLLEIMVAIAILGLGLTAILSAQAGAFESAAHARNVSVATGLLRCKMTEIEEHLYREGFQETDETGAGPCCEGDENPAMRCQWRVDRPVFPDGQFGNLDLSAGLNFGGGSAGGSGGPMGALGMLSSLGAPGGGASPLSTASSITDVSKLLADANANANAAAAMPMPSPDGFPAAGGGLGPQSSWGTPSASGGLAIPGSSSSSGSGGVGGIGDPSAGGGAGMGGIASLAMSIVYPSLKLLFEASTRRITASLIFREGKREYTIDVVEWFAVPQTGLSATDDTAASAVNATPTTTTKTTSTTTSTTVTGK